MVITERNVSILTIETVIVHLIINHYSELRELHPPINRVFHTFSFILSSRNGLKIVKIMSKIQDSLMMWMACVLIGKLVWKQKVCLLNYNNVICPLNIWALTYNIKHNISSYVYWTVHHLDSWIQRDQLDVTCLIISLFNAQHVSDVNTSILRSLRLICWVISWVVLLWFDVCWCYVVALVPQPAYGYHTTPTKPQRNTKRHRTRAIQPMK